MKTMLLTGGAGFIGSNFLQHALAGGEWMVVNVDKLTYAGAKENLQTLVGSERHSFAKADICDRRAVRELLRQHRPQAIVHMAAETHVDRSIVDPGAFITTNIEGTFCLLEEARVYLESLPRSEREIFRFVHISTDEVFGSLGPCDPAFTEETAYTPNSPYSASKAAADHLVRAYHHTYGMPTLTTNCSNNYGPHQFPEKLIPLVILNALKGLPLPIYGDGKNIRDWLFVADHCDAICVVLNYGVPGQSYNIGGRQEITNLDVVREICSILDELKPADSSYARLITFVKDRPGHDRRYAMDTTKIETDLGWHPRETFSSGLRKTIHWYLQNLEWVEQVTGEGYRSWIDRQYSSLAQAEGAGK